MSGFCFFDITECRNTVISKKLLHNYFYDMFAGGSLDDVAFDDLAIDGDTTDALLTSVGVLDSDVELDAAKYSLHLVFLEVSGDTGIDFYAVICWLDAEDELCDGVPVPGCGAGEPRVLAFSGFGGILACYHLAIDVRLDLVELLVFDPGGTDLGVMLPGIVAATGNCLANDDPWIVMAEDAGILLVTGWVGANLAHLYMIHGVGRVVEHHAMFAVEVLLAGIECLVHHAILEPDTCHGAEALRLDEDLTFLVFFRTDFVAVEVIGTQVPFSIPTMLLDGFDHLVDALLGTLGFVECLAAKGLAKFNILLAAEYEETCYHERFGLRAFGLVLGGLERLVRIP